jgi:hypothetical protein
VQEPVQHLLREWSNPDGIASVIDGLAAQLADRAKRSLKRRKIGVRIGDDGDPRHVAPPVGSGTACLIYR